MIPQKSYTVPAGVKPVELFTTVPTTGSTIGPAERVLCINRGREVLNDTYNAENKDIPPGHFITEYGAAVHFQRRLTVPGTRNPEHADAFTSWIGIYGTEDGRQRCDPPEMCEPFTDEELKRFGESVEAIDRSALSGNARDVVILPVAGVRAASPSYGMRPVIDGSQQATPEAAAAAETAMSTPSAEERTEAQTAGGEVTPSGGARKRR